MSYIIKHKPRPIQIDTNIWVHTNSHIQSDTQNQTHKHTHPQNDKIENTVKQTKLDKQFACEETLTLLQFSQEH